MKKLLILILMLLVLVGCKDETKPTVIPSNPTQTETVIPSEPTLSTEPTEVAPTTPTGSVYEDLIPNTKIDLTQNNDNQTFYLWASEGKIYLVENSLFNPTNYYVPIENVFKEINVADSINFIASINSFITMIDDIIFWLKEDNQIGDNQEYTFDGDKLIEYLNEIPTNIIPSEIFDEVKAICQAMTIKVKFTEGMLTNIEINYHDSWFKVLLQYINGDLTGLQMDLNFEENLTNPEDNSTYTFALRGTLLMMINNGLITLNLDSEVAISSDNPELSKTFDCDLLLTASDELITISGNLYECQFSDNIKLGEMLEGNFNINYSDDLYTLSFITGVDIPENILKKALNAKDFTASMQSLIEYLKGQLDIRNWL